MGRTRQGLLAATARIARTSPDFDLSRRLDGSAARGAADPHDGAIRHTAAHLGHQSVLRLRATCLSGPRLEQQGRWLCGLPWSLRTLPVGDRSSRDREALVRARLLCALGSPAGGVADLELAEQVSPLVLQLSGRDGHRRVSARSVSDLRSVEPISALAGLVEDTGEIAVECGQGARSSAEARQLRMVVVAARAAGEYRPSQQTLSPERHQTAGIEMTRMNGPEPHDGSCRTTASGSSGPRAPPRARRAACL